MTTILLHLVGLLTVFSWGLLAYAIVMDKSGSFGRGVAASMWCITATVIFLRVFLNRQE